jgi:hypothetical protein
MTSTLEVIQCMEARMNVTVWIELAIVFLRVLSAGLAG